MTRMLKQALKGVLADDEISEVYSAFDIVGDIAIIRIPDSLSAKKSIIAEAILRNVKPVKSVFAQTSPVLGDFRVRSLEHIGGENRTITTYKEHGCSFRVDLAEVYFSPRLTTERARIANLVREGEVVINMFAGVATFSVIIAKKRDCKVYSIDINPAAHALSVENAKLNKVGERVIPMLGDARQIIAEQLEGKADRILMPLPETARDYLEHAVMALKRKGVIHYFTHVHADSKREAKDACAKEIEGLVKSKYGLGEVRVVREVGPRFYQMVADITVSK